MKNIQLTKDKDLIISKGYKVTKGSVSGFSIEVEVNPHEIISYTYYNNEEARDNDFNKITNEV